MGPGMTITDIPDRLRAPQDLPTPRRVIGRVAAVWRYPISSTAGERLATIEAGPDGLAGDRRFAIADTQTGDVASPEREQRWHPVTSVRARASTSDAPEIKLPAGPWLPAFDPATSQALSAHFGFSVAVRPYGAAVAGERTVRGRYRPAHAHLLTTASLACLQQDLPVSTLDPARFRPNLLIATTPDVTGMAEQAWIGREIHIGSVRFAVNKPCGRCSFTTLPQPGLALDRDVMRALIRGHARQFGVLGHVIAAGTIAEGDAVVLV